MPLKARPKEQKMIMMAEQVSQISDYGPLYEAFGPRLQLNAPLARYSAARVGGPAEALVTATSAQELETAARLLWKLGLPFVILGGGTNVLISDAGIGGVVVLNNARQVKFKLDSDDPFVWAESGANFGSLARQAAAYGMAGLEWAAGIPGTLGGAVVGNAGAHGGDMAGSLRMAEILHQNGQRASWLVEKLAYAYRSSILKSKHTPSTASAAPWAVVLSAELNLKKSTPAEVQAKIEAYVSYRRKTQPPGASMGSMFKNPPGDYAGRLIEAAGLKGLQIGDVQISTLHANFFINLGHASAADIRALIDRAQQAVLDQFGRKLELEIELLGNWPAEQA